MHLQFVLAAPAYSAESALAFTGEHMTDFWREPFFRFYPDVDRVRYNQMSDPERYDFLLSYFQALGARQKADLEEKRALCQALWDAHRERITEALGNAFGISLEGVLDDLTCHITFNPISPRYLDRHTFDCFYLESPQGALGTALHEIIHFVWFSVWQSHFRDDPAEYESPHLKWILSEMVVDTIMRNSPLGELSPYFREQGAVYPYFYTMEIGGKPLLDTLYAMYRSIPMTRFMEESYRYCQSHEKTIRAHIEKSEAQ